MQFPELPRTSGGTPTPGLNAAVHEQFDPNQPSSSRDAPYAQSGKGKSKGKGKGKGKQQGSQYGKSSHSGGSAYGKQGGKFEPDYRGSTEWHGRYSFTWYWNSQRGWYWKWDWIKFIPMILDDLPLHCTWWLINKLRRIFVEPSKYQYLFCLWCSSFEIDRQIVRDWSIPHSGVKRRVLSILMG